MPQIVTVALYDRDNFSRGNTRQVFGYEAFHWGIVLTPEVSQGRDCASYEATDANTLDPVTFRMNNPSMNWWFRERKNINPTLSTKIIGRIVVGRVPDGVSGSEISELFKNVPLPIKNTDPQQSCVTWTMDAVQALQDKGWARGFDLAQFKDFALAFADERLKGAESKQAEVIQYKG